MNKTLALLDKAIAAMKALHEAAEPQEDMPEIPALISAEAFRLFVDAHASLLYERARLPSHPSSETVLTRWWRRLWCRHDWKPVYHSYYCPKCEARSYD